MDCSLSDHLFLIFIQESNAVLRSGTSSNCSMTVSSFFVITFLLLRTSASLEILVQPGKSQSERTSGGLGQGVMLGRVISRRTSFSCRPSSSTSFFVGIKYSFNFTDGCFGKELSQSVEICLEISQITGVRRSLYALRNSKRFLNRL